LLKENVSLLQISWKAVLQLQTCSCKTPVLVAVGSSHNTRPPCGRTQLILVYYDLEVVNC